VIVIPAIDMADGKAVRVIQGDLKQRTVYYDNPADAARLWGDGGAEIIHVVDLDGAVSGRRANAPGLEAICAATDIPVEVGGGIRTVADVKTVLECGARWAILGTTALRDPEALREAVATYGEQIIVGVDARDGMVAVEGWTETSDIAALDLAREMKTLGVGRLIVTDIATDGVLQGPNLDAMRDMGEAVGCDVTASGGISSLDDIRALAKLEPIGITSCITGKALYENKFTLPEAIAAGRGE
jgi:phosphoribosylformimino-5-aminoimidazole carboxamide ribotide isomerase